MPETSGGQTSTLRSRLVRAARWAVPPLFACIAALVHTECHVPIGEMIPRATEEDKAKAKRDKAKKRRDDAKKRERSKKPRDPSELERLREEWKTTALADEPEDANFRRVHDSLLRSTVQVAREAAFTKPPTALRVTPHCHTIRCSVEVCGPAQDVEAIAAKLPKIEREAGPLWAEFTQLAGSSVESSEAGAKPDRICRLWQVGFVVDGTKRSELIIPGEYPKPAPPPEPGRSTPSPG